MLHQTSELVKTYTEKRLGEQNSQAFFRVWNATYNFLYIGATVFNYTYSTADD
jgi:hypothetical protein